MADVLGPFFEAVAPIESLAEPVSDSPVPRVWTVATVGCIDVVKQSHVHVDREGLAPIGDEFPSRDLRQDA
jgi:hypothetical protein